MALFNRSAREAPQPTRARNSQRADDAVAALRRRARQRFVGALVLVVTAVIVIPMLLDSDPRPLDPDVDVSIPSRDKPFEPSLPPAPATGAAVPAAEPERTVAPIVANEAKKVDAPKLDAAKTEPARVEPAKVESAKTDAPKTEVARADPPKVEPVRPETAKAEAARPEAPPERKLDSAITTPKPVESAASDDARKAQALLDGKSAAAVPGKFYVQVGAFANVDGVKDLQARLRKVGVETYTEKLKTAKGERLRVRAGPFGTRPEAEQMLGKVKEVGVDGAAIVQ